MTTTPIVTSVNDELLAEIEQLASNATQGPWQAYDTHGRRFIDGPGDNTVVVMKRSKQELDDSLFIARANPATMRTIITELRQLRAKTQVTMGVGNGSGSLFVYGDYDSIKAAQKIVLEVEKLRAENEGLRKDAGRYAYIAEASLVVGIGWDHDGHFSPSPKADLDAAVDKAMQPSEEDAP